MVAKEKTGQPLPGTMEELTEIIEDVVSSVIQRQSMFYIAPQRYTAFDLLGHVGIESPNTEFLFQSKRKLDAMGASFVRRRAARKPALGRQVVITLGEDGLYFAEVPSLPGCYSQGETFEEAAINIREAIEGHVAVLAKSGREVPEERRTVRVIEV